MSNSTDSLAFVRGPFLQGTFLQLYMNGLYTGLFFLTLYGMVFKRPIYRTTPGLFVALIMMYILSTVHVIGDWIQMKLAVVDNGATGESVAIYLLEGFPLWLAVMCTVAFVLNTLIADLVLIWRCWTLWDHNWIAVTLPILCTLTGAALGGKYIQATILIYNNPRSNPGTNFGISYMSLSLGTTCVCTILIIYRIMMMSNRGTRRARGYTRVIEMMVESALLYSVTLVVFLPYLIADFDVNKVYPSVVVAQMTGIAPTLIVARVTFGLARPQKSWKGSMSTPRFRSGGAPSANPEPSFALTGLSNDLHRHASDIDSKPEPC
ncbi:hypothetical protein FB45DRAFT_1059684 [Roridomyces roridus]|uniref:Uncharacterized protein n=1 Tax=Roridomyces roridus TaxID=1738132 RepID=A0AAD7FN88_9AGAR|nr:hypothetical protein FB45DRAFT_1059684 [Roridomyces roridus]